MSIKKLDRPVCTHPVCQSDYTVPSCTCLKQSKLPNNTSSEVQVNCFHITLHHLLSVSYRTSLILGPRRILNLVTPLSTTVNHQTSSLHTRHILHNRHDNDFLQAPCSGCSFPPFLSSRSGSSSSSAPLRRRHLRPKAIRMYRRRPSTLPHRQRRELPRLRPSMLRLSHVHVRRHPPSPCTFRLYSY